MQSHRRDDLIPDLVIAHGLGTMAHDLDKIADRRHAAGRSRDRFRLAIRIELIEIREMHVRIDEAWEHVFSGSIENTRARRVEIATGSRDPSVLDAKVGFDLAALRRDER